MTTSAERAWRCSVCGYVHRDAERPKSCPVCGSPEAAFEPHVDVAAPSAKAVARCWKCLNCGYIHHGNTPPDECPICTAASDRFEPQEETQEIVAATQKTVRVVVIGAGVAGLSAVESLRAASPDAEITLVSKEPGLPYYRLNLTRYLAGEIGPEGLLIHPEEWYAQQGVSLLREAEISTLSLEESAVQLRGGEKLPFERLILTVGAHSFLPPFPGAYREGVTTFRTLDDADHILDAAKSGATFVCIGGGVLGLETAGALARRGVPVTLLEGYDWLMPRQLNQKAAELLRRHAAKLGITFRMKARTAEILGDERVRGVLLEGGDKLPADMVIVTTGIRSNSYLARMSGLEVNQGVLVDDHLFTSHPSVLAAGDVAEHRGVVYGIRGPSQYQGSIAGMTAAGIQAEFGGIPRSNTLKVLGLELFSIGQVAPDDGSFTVVEQEGDDRYYRFVFRDEHLVGAILLGDASLTVAVKKTVETRADCSALLARNPNVGDVKTFLS